MYANISLLNLLFVTLLLCSFHYTDSEKKCIPRKYNYDSIVCVCNSTYCDDILKIKPFNKDEYLIYRSSKSGARFDKSYGRFSNRKNEIVYSSIVLKINKTKKYQRIQGFGGAFTDSTGLNILKLSKAAQHNLLMAYFSENGIEYNIARVPIGGSDYSTHQYAYNMYPINDIKLSNFSLTMEDHEYKIQFIKKASDLTVDKLLLLGGAWNPPLWMKRIFLLKKEYYSTWALYHLKFLQEYEKNNVTFWAISSGNEPSYGLISENSLGWLPQEQADWIANFLGPTIKKSQFSYVNIYALDDNKYCLPWWIKKNEISMEALKYTNGIATHGYWDDNTPPLLMDITHFMFLEKDLLSTEMCVGPGVQLGSWERGEKYIKNIILVLNHWHTGWIDWNMVLDEKGGPNWCENYNDSPIIVISKQDEFLKQPMFYVMGHFSKFIPRKSERIHVETVKGSIENVAFVRPDNGISVILYNKMNKAVNVTIKEEKRGYITINLQAKSIYSLVYW